MVFICSTQSISIKFASPIVVVLFVCVFVFFFLPPFRFHLGFLFQLSFSTVGSHQLDVTLQ